jgi:Leucine-rich repeat (LRR) protein
MNKINDVKELCRTSFSERLEVLDLGNNKIQEIPIALVHYLSSLTLLNLINNDLL